MTPKQKTKAIYGLIVALTCLTPIGLLATGTAWGEWGADEIKDIASGGKALGYHLARNLGIDTVKPDRHLIKLTEHFGYSSPLEMCKDIQANLNGGMFLTKEKLGTIDVILWRSMNLTGGKIE